MLLMMNRSLLRRCCGRQGDSHQAIRSGWSPHTSRWWSEHDIELRGGYSEDIGAESPQTSGVGRRAPTSILTGVVAGPVPRAVLPLQSAFTVRPASGHRPPTRRG
jgi:hypothetical protein